jgi:uncharacterized protein (DUF488 family)
VIVHTIGFTHKSAEEFFNLLQDNKVELLVDIRLNNTSQLAGFSKMQNLEYFLWTIGKIAYLHYPMFSPTHEMLRSYQAKEVDWVLYLKEFEVLLDERDTFKDFKKQLGKYKNICLLCSEATPDRCHRSIVARYLKAHLKDAVIKDL